MKNNEFNNKHDILDYYPHKGERYEEDGKIVYWNTSSCETVEESLSQVAGEKKPLDAKESNTCFGKVIIVKWEAEFATEALKKRQEIFQK